MFFILKMICLFTIGILASDLAVWKVAFIAAAAIGLAMINFAEGYYEGYTKATEELLKIKGD